MMRAPSALFLLLAFGGHADSLLGRVVGMTDGDTVTALYAGNQQHKIRLQGIDAPEKKQPFRSRGFGDRYVLIADMTINTHVAKSTHRTMIAGG